MGHHFVADRGKHNNCEVRSPGVSRAADLCQAGTPGFMTTLRLAACPHAAYFLFKAPAFPLCLNLCNLCLPDGSQG